MRLSRAIRKKMWLWGVGGCYGGDGRVQKQTGPSTCMGAAWGDWPMPAASACSYFGLRTRNSPKPTPGARTRQKQAQKVSLVGCCGGSVLGDYEELYQLYFLCALRFRWFVVLVLLWVCTSPHTTLRCAINIGAPERALESCGTTQKQTEPSNGTDTAQRHPWKGGEADMDSCSGPLASRQADTGQGQKPTPSP